MTDCRECAWSSLVMDCMHPAMASDLEFRSGIPGAKVRYHSACSIARAEGQPCGPKAELFQTTRIEEAK